MSSITANERQVGGQHYKTGAIEHWDVVHDADVPYLLAVASKYVARHHLKAGREDLEKAIHYQEKWLEKVGPNTTLTRSWAVSSVELLGWCAAAELAAPEVRVLYAMLGWRRIDESLRLTRELLEKRYPAKTAGKLTSVTTLDIAGEYSGPLRALGPGQLGDAHVFSAGTVAGGTLANEAEPDWTHPVHQRPGTPEDGGHHARQPQEATDSGDEAEFIRRYGDGDILPESLSQHEWQHRCSEDVQRRYTFDCAAARWRLFHPATA